MNQSSNFWRELFAWLERVLPQWLVAFGLGHRIGARGKARAEKELKLSEYEREKLKNEKDIRDDNADRDIVADFIERNRK